MKMREIVDVNKYFESKEFQKLYNYDGELGAIYSKEKTKFILWAPTADEVKIAFYGNNPYDYECEAKKILKMNKSIKGSWTLEVDGDLSGEFYNYIVYIDKNENVLVDPYAKAVGVNGNRSMVIDLEATNPEQWDEDKKPELNNWTDSIIYEVHVRDFTIDESSGIEASIRGKFKGFIEDKTPLNHLKEMGFTHIHLLPSFDYASVDETKLHLPQYNWGYDPKNYNVPEGSYSTNPYKGEVRIKEFKELVQKLHREGLRVVMDVVYNHTFDLNSFLNLAVPKYYYRADEDGNYTDGSACGNETASDRYMFRKYMVDSVVYWAKEYHIDGFRFDLMGLHDIETMKEIRRELDKIDKSIIIYGEGWAGGPTPLADEKAALKKNTFKYNDLQIAAFSDDCRDGIKGHVFYEEEAGFVNGGKDLEEAIKFSVVASTKHPQVDVNKAMYARNFWANEPYQTITYASAHDNLTLWDKLQTVNKDVSEDELIKMNKLAAAIVLTSQGISFIHAGEEIARTKMDEEGNLIENSFKSSDYVNKLRWERRNTYKELMEYYKGLIKLRKRYKAFRMDSNSDIQENIKFLEKGKEFTDSNVVAYILNTKGKIDEENDILVIFNSNNRDVHVNIPHGKWSLVVNEEKAGIEEIKEIRDSELKVKAKSAYVLIAK
ncbi:type I pullulanase [Clostridium sp. NSJ-49]|uniref:type I pullulanase n=3 Tax=Clostridium TaxID=1485 RepID=UPI00164AA1CE|nr:type I pullulanase [Clostridium sp. NSJ-49]MBC5624680.1 type I pullulanase [Clostridium sp. NSJ-49]